MKYLKLLFNIMVVIICSFILFLINLSEKISETIDFWKEDNSNKERK